MAKKRIRRGARRNTPIPFPKRVELKYGADDDDDYLKLRMFEHRYTQTRNPLWAWKAYDNARHYHANVPAWVLRHFDEVALNLYITTESNAPTRRAIAPTLLRAFGFTREGLLPSDPAERKSGRYNPFTEALGIDMAQSALNLAALMKVLKGEPIDMKQIAKKLGISVRTLERRLRAAAPA